MAFSMKTTHHHHFNRQGSPASPDLQRQAVLHSFNKKEEIAQKLLLHANSYASLPLYKTPPSALKNEKAFNPFNKNLMERLESSTLSPTVFNHVISPSEVSKNEFRWTIDDISKLKPAPIEEESCIYHDSLDAIDNETEQSAQEAIERFFSRVEIPSPWGEVPKHCSSPLRETPPVVTSELKSRISSDSSAISSDTNYGRRKTLNTCLTSHAATQTHWSFPPVLPEEIETILKPYFCTERNDCDSEDLSMITSVIRRRKLNFSKARRLSERLVSYEENMNCSNRYSMDAGFTSPVSHLRSATPLLMLSPPDISPILSSANTTKSKLTTRLNFTDIDCDKENYVCERNEDIASVMMTSLRSGESMNMTADQNNTDDYQQNNDINECVSQDTGYQTHNSNDKTGWTGNTVPSDIMEITGSANTSWVDPQLQACSTPTKNRVFLI